MLQPQTMNAREMALRMLARRALTHAELHDRLSRKGVEAADVDDVLIWLHAHRLLDDHAIASSIAREAERRGKGPAWVRQRLQQRKVTKDDSPDDDAPTTEGLNLVKSQARAQDLVVKKFGHLPLQDLKTKQRAYRFLAGRGFQPDSIRRILQAPLLGDE